MHITYHGLSCFKFQGKERIIITDPYQKNYGLKLPRFRADIVFVSHSHPDHSNAEAVKGIADDRLFIISNPGEYEIKGVSAMGISSFHDNKQGQERGNNTIYLIILDKIKICHLGDLGHVLTDEQLETIGSVDILLIPVGGIYTIDAKKACEVIRQVEPRIIIPMHYKIPGLNLKIDEVNKFLKEIGVASEKMDKLKVNKKDLPSEGMRVVVMMES